YFYLSGNIFWEKVRSRAGRVVELWPLRPDKVRIIPDEDDFISGYQYEVGGRLFPLDVADVIHFKLPNPTDPFFGLAPRPRPKCGVNSPPGRWAGSTQPDLPRT